MPPNKRIKGLSPLSRNLLAAGEGDEVDFKKIPDGVSQEDLVAFANSDTGGQILVGVIEGIVGSAQVGVVRGCDVSDGAILQITNKAVSCIPPVSIKITIENLDAQPILRIAIPSSETRPHCTSKGIYNRRDGSRNRALHPNELLRIFLDTEARAFAERFEAAADRISNDLSTLEHSLDKSIKYMGDQLGWAESQMYDTESSLDEILRRTRGVEQSTGDITERFRALFRQDGRDDPVQKRERNKLVNRFIKAIDGSDDHLETIRSGGDLAMTSFTGLSPELTEEDGKLALQVAVDHVRRREDMRNYDVFCKAPKKCDEGELDAFCAIVGEGGEVIDGMKDRAKEALRLGFITYKGEVVGTAGLKKPKASYRTKVFAKAKSSQPPTKYPYELGWIYLQEIHRKKGQMTRLINELMPLAKGAGMFSTTRSANAIMQEMLAQLDFRAEGEAYPSTLQPDETLQLFLLDAEEARAIE
ncbi:GNAT family N-acetyltransferase [Rhizobium sp. Root1204]|uniref:GNAT family N-acetyltransferase n=1 Tax=Rhizobium sp. Root1204 TaxID=1736428 RepID=UPI00138F8A87|nr:GNAT family N-acetyltransferase [Rhizobium sp. Root1204]